MQAIEVLYFSNKLVYFIEEKLSLISGNRLSKNINLANKDEIFINEPK